MTNTYPIGFAYEDMALNGTSIVNSPQISMNAGTTTMTAGFLWIPSAAGPPTGTPANAPSGNVPLYYDTTNNKLYVYNGSWKSTAALT
jgi:hypothetical protein